MAVYGRLHVPCDRLDRATEAELPPGLVHGCRRRVGQIHRAPRRHHGNAHPFSHARVEGVFLRQSGRFGAEEEDVTLLVFDVREPLIRVGGEGEDPRAGEGLHTGVEIFVDLEICQVVVVQAGALEVLVLEVEAEWLDEVQARARDGGGADGVAGVGGDHGVVEDDVQAAHRHQSRMVGMSATKLDGNLYRDEIFEDLAQRVAALKEKGITPGLATVLVGDDPGSHSYVKMKHRDCEKLGINSIRKDLPADVSQEELERVITELNNDEACTGYIVQLPLPKHLDENRVLELIDPAKDADGLHPINLGKLVLNEDAPLPCTPNGCIHLLRRFGVELDGAKVVVIGRGVTVGRPIGLMLTRRSENSTVTLCHTGTKDLAAETRAADVIIAAAGKAHMLTADMVKEGAAVLDVGVSRVDGKLAGDVAEDVWEKAGFVSPNPGGVGPLTRAFLVSNIVERAEKLAAQ